MSSRQAVMLLEEFFDAQTGDPDPQEYHEQAYDHPDGSVGGQQGVERHRQESTKIDCTMNHHGDRKIISPPIDPGRQYSNNKHRWPGNHEV